MVKKKGGSIKNTSSHHSVLIDSHLLQDDN